MLAGTALMTVATPSVQAVPQLNLKPYPQPAAGERRWVIQLPGVLPRSSDPALSGNPSDWRVELIVGKEMEVDCNLHRFSGQVERETVKGWGYSIYRVSDVGPMISTRKACPPGEAKRPAFIAMGSKPYVVPYNASLPIVIYTPQDLEVRWRLWRAEKRQHPAQQR